MATMIYSDKSIHPDDAGLKATLTGTYDQWQWIVDYVHEQYLKAVDEWYYPGVKYGWCFRIKDKKRAIIYLLPEDKYFRAGMVVGEKAMAKIRESNISDSIKAELESAKVYAEGRGIRIEVRNNAMMDDIKILVDIKIAS
jgi:hypothetical protein